MGIGEISGMSFHYSVSFTVNKFCKFSTSAYSR